jgi:CRP-like cAMP-binding protein
MNRKRRWPENLRELELFSDCRNAQLERVAGLMTPVAVAAGEVLMAQGEVGREFMVIVDGRAEVALERSDGPAAELGPGDFFGEMSLLARVPRSATVTALSPLSLYVSSQVEFTGLLDAAPSIRQKVISTALARRHENRAAA